MADGAGPRRRRQPAQNDADGPQHQALDGVCIQPYRQQKLLSGQHALFQRSHDRVKGTPSGSGCYVTGFAPTLNGTRTDKDEDGNVTGTTNVSFAISFNTARFENADQINAFGGKNGVLSGLHYKKQNLLMIGTVKNDLLGALQSAAANTNEAIQVHEVVKGPAYTIFMLADSRFWGYVDVASTSLGNGIEAYGIHVMW